MKEKVDELHETLSVVCDMLKETLDGDAARESVLGIMRESIDHAAKGNIPAQHACNLQSLILSDKVEYTGVVDDVYRVSYGVGNAEPIILATLPEEYCIKFDALVAETGSVEGAMERVFALAFNVLEEE